LKHKRRKENQSSFVISVAKNSVRRKVRDPSMIRLHIIRRRTCLFRKWQRRRRKTDSNKRKNIDRNPNFVIRTNQRRFAALSPQHCSSFMNPGRTSIA
jgi:hypothetical protein